VTPAALAAAAGQVLAVRHNGPAAATA